MRLTQNQKSYSSLFGTCLLYLLMGNPYIWGGINIYVASYYKFNYQPDLTLDSASIVFAFCSFFTPLAAFLSLKFFPKMNFHLYYFIFGLFLILPIFVSSFMTNFWLFVFLFSFLFGFGCGFFYVILMINTYKYFPNRKGVASGVIMGVYGMGGFLFTLLMVWMINPENSTPVKDAKGASYFTDPEIFNRVPNAIRTLSYIYLGLFVFGYLCIFPYKEEEKEEIEQIENIASSQSLITDDSESPMPARPKLIAKKSKYNTIIDLFRSPILYFLVAMLYCSAGNGYFIATNYKNYGITKISDDNFLSLVGSLSSLSNGGGRFLWGLLLDKVDFVKAYSLLLITQMILTTTLSFIIEIRACYLIWVCLLLLCSGGHFVIFPTECVKRFGNDLGGKAYNFCLIVFSLSNITQFGLTVGIKDKVGYENELWIFLGFTGISLLNLFFYQKKRADQFK